MTEAEAAKGYEACRVEDVLELSGLVERECGGGEPKDAGAAAMVVGSLATVLGLEVAAGRTEKLARLLPELEVVASTALEGGSR